MKIDLIIGNLQSGGAERVVSLLGNHFSEKHQTRILTFESKEKYKVSRKVERLRFHKDLPVFNYTLIRAFLYLLKFYSKKENRPDIISSHIDRVGLATIPIARLYNIPIVVTEHINHTTNKYNFEKKILWNFLYKYANAVTVLTKYDLPFFQKKNKKVVVIHNPSSFKALEQQNNHRTNTVLAVGSLDRYHHKGFDNLLDIVKEAIAVQPNWKFKIVGEGPTGKEFLEKRINDLNISEHVELLGFRSDISTLLKESGIYILTSRFEGLPMVLIEATSQGIACIAYDCISGPSDIIEDGKTGILVKNQDKSEMITKLTQLMQDKKLRLNLGTNAIKGCEKFSIHEIGKQWENLFYEIIK
jgi:glycosyltransferase involved in cell wall biosynthesis